VIVASGEKLGVATRKQGGANNFTAIIDIDCLPQVQVRAWRDQGVEIDD